MTGHDPRERFLENPFYVLGLRPDATRAEVEREGQKLIGMLELGLSSAASYATPVGHGTRTVDRARRAVAELRDPEKRLGHELWARLALAEAHGEGAPQAAGTSGVPEGAAAIEPWGEAFEALGFGRFVP